MFSMNTPLTAAEVAELRERLRVQRPLHWVMARRLLSEVVRLRPELGVAPEGPSAAAPEPAPAAPAPAAPEDKGPITTL